MKTTTRKQNKIYIIGIVAAIALASIYAMTTNNLSPQEQRNNKIEAMFSPINGEHKELTRLIKESMNDPESYENINTTYTDQDTAIIVVQQYTGKNSFGGRVKGLVKAKVDIEGKVLQILEQR